jgi:hypothetical protein
VLSVQSPAKVTDKSLGARKNAKNAKDQENLLNYWAGVEIRQLDIRVRLASTLYSAILLVGLISVMLRTASGIRLQKA